MAKDWVCNNCYTQNPAGTKVCRVCGLSDKGEAIKESPEELRERVYSFVAKEEVRKDRRAERAPRARTTRRAKVSATKKASGLIVLRRFMVLIWLVSAISMLAAQMGNASLRMILAPGGAGHLGNGFRTMTGGLSNVIPGAAEVFGRCLSGLGDMRFDHIADLFVYPVDFARNYAAMGPEGFVSAVMDSIPGAALLSVCIWFLCLMLTVVIRLVRWHRMDERKGSVFTGYGFAALGVDLIALVIGLAFAGGSYQATAGSMCLNAMLAMQTAGLAIAWLVFVLAGQIRVRTVDDLTYARPSSIVSRYGKDVVRGIFMILLFAAVTLFLSAGM